ncbi:aminotransferase class I/II-fold pyridoxal phosphate-dependent enzyme [Heliobacterium gestii]|uniref:Aminotransferase class I/II-fold pyridoxal phosphate-dependent enzyme n=1 Tax=Heliomicrobium gestii TaxID=2699 RepID=A0A845L8R0_HELGE|nr:aminotransferase class I/II-fold pyridoxal phosphate-dependent enzyme [Heliomicrobium gestii]MBM7866085.1 cystathionine gamma-synthase [Heliomicrobium gestii]MZP42588.1 aminotransferase class I/II-fold pyridoxal phosphate-dependent enzyme [Heliomicrobium gestii]
MRIDTLLAQGGNGKDTGTGAVSFPIYQTATFQHPALGESTGFDYSRSGNPTRQVLEEQIARLEGGRRGLAFASGLAALTAVLSLFRPGDHLILCEDLYGGTYRLLEQVFRPWGVEADFVDTSDLEQVNAAVRDCTKAILIETPTNPTMKITDLQAIRRICDCHDLLLIVDNTFMSPYLQRPIELGAHIVVHSGTKYLGGHNDVVAGLVVAADEDLGERLAFYQNAAGAILGPFDSWLLLRGMKTLGLRLDRAQENASAIACWLEQHPAVEQVYFIGLDNHPGRDIHFQQAAGPGAMISFSLHDAGNIPQVLSRIRLIAFAESLGGVESLLTFPSRQTHGDIPEEIRRRCGVTDRLLRLSVGIENISDLLNDLTQALAS